MLNTAQLQLTPPLCAYFIAGVLITADAPADVSQDGCRLNWGADLCSSLLQQHTSFKMLRQTVPEGYMLGWKKPPGNLHCRDTTDNSLENTHRLPEFEQAT